MEGSLVRSFHLCQEHCCNGGVTEDECITGRVDEEFRRKHPCRSGGLNSETKLQGCLNICTPEARNDEFSHKIIPTAIRTPSMSIHSYGANVRESASTC
jgi:hypothetical protein